MEFTYLSGSSSTLGAAADTGGWTASGTYTVSGGATQNWPYVNVTNGYNRKTDFTYKEYLNTCNGYSTHATDWEGGNTTSTVSIQPAGDCVPENATQQNPTFDLNYSQAWTYSTGVTVPQIGINLSARSGYSNATSTAFWFTDFAHQRYLCGRTGFPGYTAQSPGYLVAGASSSGGS